MYWKSNLQSNDISKQEHNTSHINLNGIPDGVYLLTITDGKQYSIRKILITGR